jgi:hypothetical protein
VFNALLSSSGGHEMEAEPMQISFTSTGNGMPGEGAHFFETSSTLIMFVVLGRYVTLLLSPPFPLCL